MAKNSTAEGGSAAHEGGSPRGLLKRFFKQQSGAVALLFGLTLIPMLGFVGGAIDYVNAHRYRTQLQNALDAAALAAGREMDASGNQSNAQQIGSDVLQANLGPDFPSGVSANFAIADNIVTASASLPVDTFLLGVLGINTIPVATNSIVNIAGGTYEVVMVLDNSGSMEGSKIADLRDAAKNLVNILFSNQLSADHVQIGLVPFAASVNVGPQYATASWMDQSGQSSIHYEHLDQGLLGLNPLSTLGLGFTRWDVFNAIPNASWAGCVEVRPAPHDVNDTPPTGGDSLFVPLFAPDEPDSGSGYKNDYLDDDDGMCLPWVSGGNSYTRQRRVCKYITKNADTSLANGTRRGPNHMCDAQPLQPLANNQGQLIGAIDAMEAYGGTNIHEALMWGWRLLSPGEPFTEGKPYNEANHTKIIILMTDGANWHSSLSTHNESWFTAYGYHAQNRLNSPGGSTSTLRATMNARTSQACTNAKATGIVIYTLALEVDDTDTQDMLRDCATSPSRYFTLDNSNALDDAFEAIAKEITKLRIAS